MSDYPYLESKRILIVDDEPDVLDSLEDLLEMCQLTRASNFADARALLENRFYDIVILDIMGVDGYELLEIATAKNVTAVMLTAHAFSPDHLMKSYQGGAASYLPKEEMINIASFLNDIWRPRKKGKIPGRGGMTVWDPFWRSALVRTGKNRIRPSGSDSPSIKPPRRCVNAYRCLQRCCRRRFPSE
jgi:CheY-like chemotaxis protein